MHSDRGTTRRARCASFGPLSLRAILLLTLTTVITAPSYAATVQWALQGSGSWNVASNWSPAQVPTAADDVILGVVGTPTHVAYTVTLSSSVTVNSLTVGVDALIGTTSTQTLDTNGWSITVAGTNLIEERGTLLINGGTVRAAIHTVQGTFSVNSGTIAGPGTMTIALSASVTLGGTGYPALDALTITNNGTITYGGTAYLTLSNGTVLDNNKTVTVQADQMIYSINGANTINNNAGATFTKSSGTGVTDVTSIFNNSGGTLAVDAGTLELSVDGSHTGPMTVGSGATLKINGGIHSLAAGASIAGAGTLQIAAGQLNVDTPLTIGTALVKLTGGTLGGSANRTIANQLDLEIGTITGAGTTTIDASGIFNIPGVGYPTIDATTVTNLGTLTYSATGPYLSIANGGTLTNAGTMNITGSSYFYAYGGTNRIVNSGTLTKSGAASVTTFNPTFENSGTVNVQTGTLSLNAGGSHSGALNVSAGALVDFNGGTHTFGGGAAVQGAGDVDVSSGIVNVDAPLTINVAVFRVSGGTFGGAASRVINNKLDWISGTITGAPATTTEVAATGMVQMATAGYPTLDAHTLIVRGATTYAPPSGYLTLTNGSLLANYGSFTLGGDAQIYTYGATSSFANAVGGSVTKSGGTGVAYIYPAFNNDGALVVSAGTVALSGGGTSGGSFAASGGIVQFANGTHTLGASSSVSGSGEIRFSGGTTNLSGSYAPTGLTVVSGGIAAFTAAATSAGLTISSGTLESSSTFAVSGAFSFNGGTLKGAGTTTVLASGSAALLSAAGYPTIDGHTLVLAANSTFGGATYAYYLTIVNGGVLQNGGIFTIQDDSYIYGYGTPAPRIDNSGTFRKTGGTAESAIYPAFNNSGATEASAGTLVFYGGGTSSGSFAATTPGTLRFSSSGTIALTAASSVSGTGTIRFSGGTTTIAGSYLLTGSGLTLVDGGTALLPAASTPNLTINSGTLEATAALTVSGAFAFNGGTLKGAGTTTIQATGSASFINSGGYPTLDAHTLLLQADSTLGGGTYAYYLTVINGGVVQNAATFTIVDDSYIYGYGTPAPRIDNAGTFRKTGGTGESYVYPSFNSTGTTEVSSGTLSLFGGGTSSGSFAATAPATLRFAGSPATSLSTASSVSGTGTVRFSNGAVSVGGSYALTGNGLTLVDGGSPTFGPASTPGLTIKNGTLEATAAFTVSGPFLFDGGTLRGAGTTTIQATGSASFINTGGYPNIDGHTLVLDANGSLGGGTYAYYVTLYNGAVLRNNATFTLLDDSYFYGYGTPAPRIINAGTLQKSGGTGVSAIYAFLENTGTVAVTSGTLAPSGGGSGAGAFNVGSGAILKFNGGTHTLTGAITSSGTVEIGTGTVDASGSFSNTGLTSVLSGALSLTMASASMQDLQFNGGSLGGSAQVGVAGTMNWLSGQLGGTVVVTIAPAPAAVNLTGPAAKYIYGGVLRNGGTATWTDNGPIYGNAGGRIENLAGATFQAINDGLFYNACCGTAPLFDNQAGATFTREGAATATRFYSSTFQNAGTVTVASGTLEFNATPFTQTGGIFQIAAGATALSNASVDFQGGAFMGGGTFTGNVLNSGAAVRPGTSPGALTIDGSYTQGASGALDVELGGVTAGTGFDQLNITGTASLGGTLNVALVSPYAPPSGSSYRILTFGALAPFPNNAFATTNGTDVGGGNTLQVSAGATYIDLVTNGNASPAAVADAQSTPEDAAVVISVLANDSDPDGDPLTISGSTPATHGAAGCGTTTCTYTPDTNYFGPDSFTYTVTDGFTSSTATVTITVTSVNDPPVAANDSGSTAGGTPVTLNVLANDTDVDGGSLSVASFTQGANGSVACTASACTYTPGSGFSGTDSFTYTVSDGAGGSATATVLVTVTSPCPSEVLLLNPGAFDEMPSAGKLSWRGGTGAASFSVYLGPRGSGCETLFATTTSHFVPYSGLEPGQYEWRVVANTDGCSESSTCRRFTVIPPCPTEGPGLVSPLEGETPLEVTFRWRPVVRAIRYRAFASTAGGTNEMVVGQPAGALPETLAVTATLPAGPVEWWVIAEMDAGCADLESVHRNFTAVSPCPTGRPEPIEPLAGRPLESSPVEFRWSAVDDTDHYELYLSINGASFRLAGTVAGTAAAPSLAAAVPAGAAVEWYVDAVFREGCGRSSSPPVRLSVSCYPPVLSLQGEVTTAKPYQVRATIVSVGVRYVFQESLTQDFATIDDEKEGAVDPTGEFVFAEFEHSVPEPRPFYYRVKLDQEGCEFSGVGRIVVVPLPPPTSTETETVVQFGNEEEIRQPLFIPSPTPEQPISYTYLATTDREWMRVEPPGGTLGAAGVTVMIITNPVGLPVGTNTGTVTLTFTNLAGKGALETTPVAKSTPVSVTLVTPVTNKGKEGPNAESLIIPAVAHATGLNSEWQTDVRIVNLGSDKRKYQLLWTSTATDATLSGKNCELELAAGQSAALDDIVKQWYGLGSLPGEGAQGVLEIRPLEASGPGKGAAGVPVTRSLVSVASSRMYNRTPQGTLGEFIPAIPFAAFVGGSTPENGKKSVLSLQQLAQSSAYRTNIGVSEASGNPVSVEMRFFDADGTKILTVPVDLRSGEHRQFNQILAMNGLTNVAAARAEVEVLSGSGKITAYASVIDNVTGDPLQVHAVDLAKIGARKYVMPGVAHFDTGQARWRTDVQMFNAGLASVSAEVAFFPTGASAPTRTATVEVDPGTIRTLSDIVPALFGESNTGGAIQISTATSSELVITGRTYDQRESGSYGQFMAAVTEDDAIGLGDRSMQVLQLEQSANIRSNLGIVEVSGKEVRVELSAFPAESRVTPRVELTLRPNEFRQLNQVLKSLNAGTTYNARIALRVIGGEGKIVAYGSTVDNMTQDPTFIPGQ